VDRLLRIGIGAGDIGFRASILFLSLFVRLAVTLV
jgi:hypothetical protein